MHIVETRLGKSTQWFGDFIDIHASVINRRIYYYSLAYN